MLLSLNVDCSFVGRSGESCMSSILSWDPGPRIPVSVNPQLPPPTKIDYRNNWRLARHETKGCRATQAWLYVGPRVCASVRLCVPLAKLIVLEKLPKNSAGPPSRKLCGVSEAERESEGGVHRRAWRSRLKVWGKWENNGMDT